MGINKNEIHIKYLIKFIKVNNKKCYIIYNEKRYNLMPFLDISKCGKKDKNEIIIEIRLIGLKNIKRFDAMFYKCSSLLSISDLQRLNTRNIIDMKFMFHGCSLLKKLPDISNWKTNKVNNMAMMFAKCSSLKYLPDISK